jgi:hypothetical protein
VTFRVLAAAVAAFASSAIAQAALPVYSTPRSESLTSNHFVATGRGIVTAYFAGYDASFDSRIGLSINDAAPTSFGLLNKTARLGESFVLGTVNKGDTLEFILEVNGGRAYYSTTKPDNSDNFNHAWSTHYSGGDFGIPAGIFVAFEDLPGGGDRDYNDHVFVFTFLGSTIPEPASWAMLITGFGFVGLAARRRRTTVTV